MDSSVMGGSTADSIAVGIIATGGVASDGSATSGSARDGRASMAWPHGDGDTGDNGMSVAGAGDAGFLEYGYAGDITAGGIGREKRQQLDQRSSRGT